MIDGVQPRLLHRHWFVPLGLLIVLADVVAAMNDDWSNPRILEAILLIDLALVIPALYWWCYRARGRQAILRAVALGCFGVWVAGHLVPDEQHHFLGAVWFLRYLGIAMLFALELKLVVMIYRAAFVKDGDAASAAGRMASEAGMPEWAMRLIAWEASFWRKAWAFVKRSILRR